MTTTFAVSSQAELNEALKNASGGDTILLSEGNYGGLSIEGRKYDSEIVIKSANPDAPATFNSLNLHRTENVTLDGLLFDYDHAPGAFFKTSDFNVTYGENITIRNSEFDGVEEGFGLGFGLVVRWTEGFTLENTTIHEFYRGFVIRESQDIVVEGNELYGMSSDGLNFAEVENVRIADNYLHDFARPEDSGAHPDMIQFWTNGTSAPSKNIVIRDNRLDIGDGMWTQSIFMRNEKVDSQGGGRDFFYENILIEDNVIINGHLHGITVGETDGLTIRNNVVLHAEGGQDAGGGGVSIPSMRVKANSTDVEITGNITSYIEENSGLDRWDIGGNVFLQDTDLDAANHYTEVFVDSSLTLQDGVHLFVFSEEGKERIGSAGPDGFGEAPKSGPQALFDYVQDSADPNTYVFDATATLIDSGNLPNGAELHWSFGDGAEATGLKVEHRYADPGRHEVQLTVRLPDGTEDQAEVEVTAQSEKIVGMKTGVGFTVYSEDNSKDVTVGGMTDDGIATGGTGKVGSIWRAHVNDIIGADSFGMSITLKSDSPGASGELFRIHETITANVTASGELYLNMRTEGGTKRIRTENANLNDTQLHDIRIDYLGRTLTIVVDGDVVGALTMGRLTGGNRDLDFGNAWGEKNFSGLITEFVIDRGDREPLTAPETEVLDNRFSTGSPTAPTTDDAPVDAEDKEAAYGGPEPEDNVAPSQGAGGAPDSGDAEPEDNDEDDTTPESGTEDPTDDSEEQDDGVAAQGGEDAVEAGDGSGQDHTDGSNDAPATGGSTFAVANTGVSAAIAFSDIGRIRDSDAFEIGFKFRSDDDSTGELFRMHGSFIAQVTGDGDLRLVLFTDKGKVVQKTSGVDLSDGQWYDIAITLQDGKSQIRVNNTVVAEADVAGEISNNWWHALSFGNPWGNDNHKSEISDFDVLFRTNGNWHAVSMEEDTERDGALFDVDYLRKEASEAARTNDVVAETRVVEADLAEAIMDGSGVFDLRFDELFGSIENPVYDASPEAADETSQDTADDTSTDTVDESPPEPIDDTPQDAVDDLPEESIDETAFTVADTGVSAAIAFEDIGGIRNSDTFMIGFKFRSTDDGQGELFRMHGSFVSRVSDEGEFTFQLFTDEGKIVSTTLGADLDDGAWHDIAVTYTGSSIQIAVDGVMRSETEVTGEIAKTWWHALSFGNPWGKDNHRSEIADFDVLFQRNETWHAVSMEEDGRAGDGFAGAGYLNSAASDTAGSNDVSAKTTIVDSDLAEALMANGGVFSSDFDELIFN